MRRHRSYKFTDKHHSRGGIRSSVAAAFSLGFTGAAVFLSYLFAGEGANYLAVLGFGAIVCCIYGVIVGKKSFQEEECYYLFSRIGTVVNGILACFWVAVCGMGVFM